MYRIPSFTVLPYLKWMKYPLKREVLEILAIDRMMEIRTNDGRGSLYLLI